MWGPENHHHHRNLEDDDSTANNGDYFHFPPNYKPFISLQTVVAVIIPVFAFFLMFFIVMFMFYVYRRLCSKQEVFEHIICDDEELAIPRPTTPGPESFRRNSAQAQFRLLMKSKFEKEFGKSRAEYGLLMPVRIITSVSEEDDY
ncbi:unnamed protein product [Caenorhabditis angaria]|uniref:Uncharacterized protein n=1 Tax=Caenorhabditis angaria TaxID=860376 RepID=A0A9P1IN50_9PELO|nr:unnamed protein product [Caenorhabditis angaria]